MISSGCRVSISKFGRNGVQTRNKLPDVYGEDAFTVRQYQNSFEKFGSCNFDVEDAPRSGSTIEADKDKIKPFIDASQNTTVYNHLKGLGSTT